MSEQYPKQESPGLKRESKPVAPLPSIVEQSDPFPSRLRELRFFARYLKPIRKWVLGLTVAGLAVNLFRAPVSLIPLVLTKYFDYPTFLYAFLAGMAVCLLIMGLSMLIRGYLGSRIGEHLLRTLRRDLFAQLERLSILAIYSRGTGPFSQRLARDVYYIRDLFNQTFVQALDESTRFIVCGAMCLWLDPVLTVILIGLFLLFWPIVRIINNRVETLAKRGRELSEEVLSQLVENIGGFRDILATGRFDRFSRKFGDVLREGEVYGVRTSFWQQAAEIFPRTWISLLLVIPYGLVAGQLETREDAGRVISFVLLIQQVLPVFGMLAQASSNLAIATPSMRAIRNVLEMDTGAAHERVTPIQTTIGQNGHPHDSDPIESIRFDHVCLDLGGRRILHDLCFEIPGGKLTAVIGQSGAGKTSVFHLLLRLIEPTSGTIYVNGHPIEEIDENWLRRRLGFIPQNPFIFNQSLRENILIAATEETDHGLLERAVEISQLAEVVENREGEGGLNAVAGYMGAKLSGGERQRVALARLVLQDPPVIICDEYTANIDVKTARLIHDTMRSVFSDRTRIIITHELYPTKGADHIVVLEKGAIVQTGNHRQLVREPGLYRELWEMQNLESQG